MEASIEVYGNNLQDSGKSILKCKILELMCGFSSGKTFVNLMLELLEDTPISLNLSLQKN